MIQIGEQKDMPYTTTSANTRITNADRIRAMTDEELAKELDEKGYCPHNVLVCVNVRRWCNKCVRDWLKQEAKE